MEHVQITNITIADLENIVFQGIKRQIDQLNSVVGNTTSSALLTRDEVATLFKINLSTLHSWTRDGKLKSYGIGGRVYYKRSEIDESLIKLN
ncbi:MAG TPA: helix-turn-helix domain-containing protein [Flavobacterium sp.]|jgi:excisionase family DNA binding protein